MIGLGTWVMGGSLWGGAEDRESLETIREALALGVTLIDTAPVYGYGRAESLVGRALAETGTRDRVLVSTKVGLEWNDARTITRRNSSRVRILQEIEDSLRRLRTDRIDLYHIHWPDANTPFEESMQTLLELKRRGVVRAIGLSNFTVEQMRRCLDVGPVDVVQPPYNLFEREVERGILPFCLARNVPTMVYGALCRGLLTGKYRGDESFGAGDVRAMDPKFQGQAFRQYADCARRLRPLAARHGKTLSQLAVRWCLDRPGVTAALCGARRPDQIRDNAGAVGWTLSAAELEEIERIVEARITAPVGPEFMAPR